jgi:hypothetical protein
MKARYLKEWHWERRMPLADQIPARGKRRKRQG